MELQLINGREYYVKRGGIEGYGTARTGSAGQGYSSITFADGEVIKNVFVDTALTLFVDLDDDSDATMVFKRAGGVYYLVAIEAFGKFRVSTATALGAKAGLNTFYGLVSAFLALIGVGIISGAGAIGFLWFVPTAAFAYFMFKEGWETQGIKTAADELRTLKSIPTPVSTKSSVVDTASLAERTGLALGRAFARRRAS